MTDQPRISPKMLRSPTLSQGRASSFLRLSQALCLALPLAIAGCASPPLKLYTLAPPQPPVASTAPATFVQLTRVTLPDYIDNQSILVRDGSLLKNSSNARWAERLSSGITDLLVADLAASHPDLLIGRYSVGIPANTRIEVSISRLDITSTGEATLVAQWAFIPADEKRSIQRGQTVLHLNGATDSSAAIVALTQKIVTELSSKISAQLASTL